MNDQERITDFLCSEKKMSANCDTFASECVNLSLQIGRASGRERV